MADYSKGKSEKEGLIPVTCKILKNLVKKDEKLEYMNVPVGEIVIVGFAFNYLEQETKISVGIWDQTGYFDVSFFNKNESETHSGLEGYYHVDKGVIKIIGKVKLYKDNIKIDGARIVNSNFNEFVYHKLEVISDWHYLTNEQNQDDDNYHLKSNNKQKNNAEQILSGGKDPIKEKIKKECMDIISRKGQIQVNELANETGLNEIELTKYLKAFNSEGLLLYNETSNEVYSL